MDQPNDPKLPRFGWNDQAALRQAVDRARANAGMPQSESPPEPENVPLYGMPMRRAHLAESVEVPNDIDPEATRDPDAVKNAVRRWFLASFVFAALAWLATLVVAIKSSETNGIYASWVAVFPTAFGGAGLFALESKPPGKALLIAFAAGVAGVAGLWFFFEGIWPSL